MTKTIDAPVFHVNADCIEDVCYVFKIAAEYRAKFEKDVVIDLIGYRKNGHNELDNPNITNPHLQKLIDVKTPVAKMYEDALVAEGVFTQDQVTSKRNTLRSKLEGAFKSFKNFDYKVDEWDKGNRW